MHHPSPSSIKRPLPFPVAPALKYKIHIGLLFLAVILIFGFAAWNASSLQSAINQQTQGYISDVSSQLADDINGRLSNITQGLELLEDGILRFLDGEQTKPLGDYLRRKAELMGATGIVLTDLEGNVYSTIPTQDDIFSLPGVQAALREENGLSFLDGQSLLYSVPLHQDSEIIGTLSCIRDRENMQRLIQTQSFSGKCLTCIIDHSGEVVISPTELAPFMQLEEIFTEQPDSQEAADIFQMQEKLLRGESGIFSFTATDHTNLILAYYPLNSYGLVLLTLVPADLISYSTGRYINQTFLNLFVIIILFLLILVTFLQSYRTHYREMEQIAFIDTLTGGMNNTAFQLNCSKLLQGSPPNSYAVAFLNIKNFKLINERFGIPAGDNTLCMVMSILQKHVRENELAARADADSFFLCLHEYEPEAIRRRLQEITESVNLIANDLEEHYQIVIQSGVYIVEQSAMEVPVIQGRARTACRNRTSDQDGLCIFYDASFTLRLQREQELNALFATSLQNGDFKVYLQPKVRLDGSIGGAEALVRWFHPQQGMISPGDFIPLFETNGNICKLDLYVFEEVCRTLHRWKEQGRPLFPISVNLSRQHFKQMGFLAQFQELVLRYDVPPQLIELELTESIFFDDQHIGVVKEQIHAMHRLGFSCSLDDFGSGYSSLSHLSEFPIDVLKLDRRFFLHADDQRTPSVLAAIISLARTLGAETVAEGIETPSQLELLRDIQCDMVQGYIFSRPLPIPELEAWVDQR